MERNSYFKNVQIIADKLSDFGLSSGFYVTTEIIDSRHIRVLPGKENVLYGKLLVFVCELVRVHGARFFVTTANNNQPYIVIYFLS